MKNDTNRPYRDKPYFRWGITALVVIIISILLVVIFTDIPGFFFHAERLPGRFCRR